MAAARQDQRLWIRSDPQALENERLTLDSEEHGGIHEGTVLEKAWGVLP